ncbi:MAG: helix-turn-helix domain-containing protein [Polyangiaceae bacterium]
MNPDSANESKHHPLRTRLKEMVATAILEAAEVVFAERGLEARLEDVAAHAGVAVGTLYNYFKDWQSLVEALLDAHRSQLRERLSEVVVRTEGYPFRERLEAILAEIVTVSLPKQRLRLLLLQAAPHRFLRRSEARESLRLIIGPMFEQARMERTTRARSRRLAASAFTRLGSCGSRRDTGVAAIAVCRGVSEGHR